ncbi:MAG TPA: 3'-5' exonuclease [Thiobacillus sp.]
MSWLHRLFSPKPELTPQQAERLTAWQALPTSRPNQPIRESRYVVVDVESSGLNTARDHLIAIGAVAIVNGQIALSDSHEIVLQQTHASDKDNILIHGIGGTDQREGTPPAEALLDFLAFLRKDPLIAFHVAFDQAMLERALASFLGLKFEAVWVDLTYLAPALYPQIANRTRTLDDWAHLFQIHNYARHHALADALVTAELFLALQTRLAARGAHHLRDMKTLEYNWRRQIQPV